MEQKMGKIRAKRAKQNEGEKKYHFSWHIFLMLPTRPAIFNVAEME